MIRPRTDRLPVLPVMHKRLVGAAREFRKEPAPSEQSLWRALRGRQVMDAKFRRQRPIGPFVVDFLCSEQALIIEVDGPVHANQVERDRERQQLLEACGYRVIRITADEVEQDLSGVIRRIEDAIAMAREVSVRESAYGVHVNTEVSSCHHSSPLPRAGEPAGPPGPQTGGTSPKRSAGVGVREEPL